MQDGQIKAGVQPYTVDGPYGTIFDASESSLRDDFWIMIEMGPLMQLGDKAVMPALMYMFHELEDLFDGRPTQLVLDEAWLFLRHETFKRQQQNWLKTLRKKNVACIYATQEIADAAKSDIASTILQQCHTKIYLPDEEAQAPGAREMYRSFGLSDPEIDLIARSQKKRDYFYKSSLGTRLFRLELGPIQLGLITGQDHAFLDELLRKEQADVLYEVLEHKSGTRWGEPAGKGQPDLQRRLEHGGGGMKGKAMLVALLAGFVFQANAQDAFSPLIYAEEVAQTTDMIQQIQNELKEVSYVYQSLQSQIQSLKSLKLNSYTDFMSFLGDQASYVLTTESRIKALQISVNGENFALNDVLGYWDAYQKKIGDMQSGNGDASDAQAAYDLLGMSPDLVTVANQLKDLTTSAARKSTALAADNEKHAKDEQQKIQDLLVQAQGEQSVVAGLQTGALLQGEIAQELLDLKLQTGELATNVAGFTADLQRNGVPLARSAQDEAIVGEEVANPLSADFFTAK